jgi:hypothetical protein
MTQLAGEQIIDDVAGFVSDEKNIHGSERHLIRT